MFKNDELKRKSGLSGTIGVGTWMAVDAIALLSVIPVVGSIAALVIYIYLLAAKATAPSIKNRIAADLIWVLIALVLFLVVLLPNLHAMVQGLSSAMIGDGSVLARYSPGVGTLMFE